MLNLLFLLNLVVYIPIGAYWDNYSWVIRGVQFLTIVMAFSPFCPIKHEKRFYYKVSVVYFVLVVLALLSSLTQREVLYSDWLKLFLHFLYFLSLCRLVQTVSQTVFKCGLIILVVAFVLNTFLHINLNLDFSVFNISKVETYGTLKHAKGEMAKSGFTLSNVAVLPLLFFILIPYIYRDKGFVKISILALVVFLLLIFSTNFTCLLSFMITMTIFVVYTIARKKIGIWTVYSMLIIAVGIVVVLTIQEPKFLYRATTGRALLWELALSLIAQNPLNGICETDFYPAIHPFFILSDFVNHVQYSRGMFSFTSGTCHDMYLNWGLLYGIPSLCVYLYFITILYKKIYVKAGGIAVLVPFIYVLVRGLTESTGFIYPSSGIIEYVFDIYLAFTIFNKRVYGKDCAHC